VHRVFPLRPMYSEASEKSQIVSLYERYVEWVGGHEGVGWVAIERIVDGFKREETKWVSVEGG
jgi:hypothetical protein